MKFKLARKRDATRPTAVPARLALYSAALPPKTTTQAIGSAHRCRRPPVSRLVRSRRRLKAMKRRPAPAHPSASLAQKGKSIPSLVGYNRIWDVHQSIDCFKGASRRSHLNLGIRGGLDSGARGRGGGRRIQRDRPAPFLLPFTHVARPSNARRRARYETSIGRSRL